jgi:hypothetical protein
MSKRKAKDAEASDEEEDKRTKLTESTLLQSAWAAVKDDLLRLNPSLSREHLESDNGIPSRPRIAFDEDGESLRYLNLSCLGLVALPESISQFRTRRRTNQWGFALEHRDGAVRLQRNKLTALPESFGDLVVGGDLHLEHNLLEDLPQSFGRLIVGANLHLQRNRLSTVPASFANVTVGIGLHLQGNPFPRHAVGGRARIFGVKSRPELNGQIAECLELDQPRRRWRVRLQGREGDGEEEVVSLKETCLDPTLLPGLLPNVVGMVTPPHSPGDGHAMPFIGKKGMGTAQAWTPSFGAAAGDHAGDPFRRR